MNGVIRGLVLVGLALSTAAAQAVDCAAVRARFQCAADGVKYPLHLSFDDGPALQTADVLDVLKRERVPATFFVLANKIECKAIADQCAANGGQFLDEATANNLPGNSPVDCKTAVQQCEQRKQILTRAKREGHTIGSHSYQHLHYSEVDPALRREHFRLARQLLNPYLTTNPPLFRLPYGDGWFTRDKDGRTMQALKEAGFQHVAWQFSAFDWDEKNQQGDKILANVLEQVCHRQQGGVVLFHDGMHDHMHKGRVFTTTHLQEWIPSLRCVVDFKPLSFFEKGYTARR